MGHRFHDGGVGVEHVSKNVFSVTCRTQAHDAQRRALFLNLLPQIAEHVHGVFDRIALGELIALHQDALVFIKQYGFRRSGAAVDPHEALDHLPGLELRRHKFLGLISFFERLKLCLVLA